MHQPRLMVIGLDSVSLTLLDRFKNSCPNIQAFLRRGASGRALPCFPVYTPTNWAALSTGADSSTTGAEGWYNEEAGKVQRPGHGLRRRSASGDLRGV
jgi:predicted AlkP superfamily phosphohydrolase/phosphomutase